MPLAFTRLKTPEPLAISAVSNQSDKRNLWDVSGKLRQFSTDSSGRAALFARNSAAPNFASSIANSLSVSSSESGQNFDLSAVSDLSLTYRTPQIEAQAGRQRFLSGPTQTTLYGSLIRQGEREIMDAVRVSKSFGAQRVEAAYLVDAYPRNLPFRVGGLQQGFLARYSLPKKTNIGLNAIKYFDWDRSNKLGLSLDTATSLGKSGVDLYGEIGRDTYRALVYRCPVFARAPVSTFISKPLTSARPITRRVRPPNLRCALTVAPTITSI